ncbi:MAG: NAD(P)-binding protein [Streptosporangiaceae bacterium]
MSRARQTAIFGHVAEHYDVIIVGSGAGGGTLAHTLAPSGKRILLLERGISCRARSRTGIPARCSWTVDTSHQTSGSTRTVSRSSRRCITTSGWREHGQARPRATGPGRQALLSRR